MATGDELAALLSGARDRTPSLAGKFRHWARHDRLIQAHRQSRRPRASGGVAYLIGSANRETDATTRLWVRPERGWYRQVQESGQGPKVLGVSDGVNEWRPTVTGAFSASRADPGLAPAGLLLDPSWLLGYTWETAVPGVRGWRKTLTLRARWSSSLSTLRIDVPLPGPTRRGPEPPEDAEVVIDEEFGFLYRLTGLVDGQPYEVQELLDVEIETPRDVSFFRIDSTEFQVFESPDEDPEQLSESWAKYQLALAEPPTPTWSDLGATAPGLRAALDARMGRLPLERLRSWSDFVELHRVECDHVERLARRYGLSGDDCQTLTSLWFARFDSDLAGIADQLRVVERARLARVHRRQRQLGRYRLGGLYWNTLGPGGETWFGDHLPLRRYLFRLHWRP